MSGLDQPTTVREHLLDLFDPSFGPSALICTQEAGPTGHDPDEFETAERVADVLVAVLVERGYEIEFGEPLLEDWGAEVRTQPSSPTAVQWWLHIGWTWTDGMHTESTEATLDSPTLPNQQPSGAITADGVPWTVTLVHGCPLEAHRWLGLIPIRRAIRDPSPEVLAEWDGILADLAGNFSLALVSP